MTTPDRPHYETIVTASDGQKSIVVNWVTQAEWDAKCAEVEQLKTKLVDELSRMRQMEIRELTEPKGKKHEYDIALRPELDGANPMDSTTLLDDIVVDNVELFRAEAMGDNNWWVCCYLPNSNDDRICWSVTSDTPIRWVTTEYPTAVYEHDLKEK